MIADAGAAYTDTELENELRQSEIISGLEQHIYDPVGQTAVTRVIPYALVMTQDCDLLRDWEATNKDEVSVLNGVLLYEAEHADTGRNKPGINSTLWRSITANQSERYHFLSEITADQDKTKEGIPTLVIDFRRCFTMASSEILRQISSAGPAKRRCRLITPYREHLQTRAAFYFQRVALPTPHSS